MCVLCVMLFRLIAAGNDIIKESEYRMLIIHNSVVFDFIVSKTHTWLNGKSDYHTNNSLFFYVFLSYSERCKGLMGLVLRIYTLQTEGKW